MKRYLIYGEGEVVDDDACGGRRCSSLSLVTD